MAILRHVTALCTALGHTTWRVDAIRSTRQSVLPASGDVRRFGLRHNARHLLLDAEQYTEREHVRNGGDSLRGEWHGERAGTRDAGNGTFQRAVSRSYRQLQRVRLRLTAVDVSRRLHSARLRTEGRDILPVDWLAVRQLQIPRLGCDNADGTRLSVEHQSRMRLAHYVQREFIDALQILQRHTVHIGVALATFRC